MGLESAMWNSLKNSIGKYWDATRHEDKLSRGVPDVSFGTRGLSGWIELKALLNWPKRPETVVSLPHYTAQQRLWLWNRGKHCNTIWLLVRVGNLWLLFDHVVAQNVGKNLNKDEMLRLCQKVWIGVPTNEDFINTITRKTF